MDIRPYGLAICHCEERRDLCAPERSERGSDVAISIVKCGIATLPSVARNDTLSVFRG